MTRAAAMATWVILAASYGTGPARLGAPPSPAQSPDSVAAACAQVARLADRVLELQVRVEHPAEITNEFAPREARQRTGCRVSGRDDTDRTPAPVEMLVEAMQAEGWRALLAYQADGPDGSLVGLVLGETLCIVRGSWDGGDDSDTTYVPAPGYELEVSCFRRTAADGGGGQ